MKNFLRMFSLSLVVCLCVACTMTSCGKSVYEQYKAAYEKTDTAEYMDADLVLNMSIKYSGVTVDMPIKMSFKGHQKDNKCDKMNMAMNTEIAGKKLKIDAYMNEEYMYMNANDQKVKASIEDIKKEQDQMDFSSVGIDTIAADFSEDMLKDASVTKTDGVTTVAFTVIGDAVKTTLGKLSDTAMNMMGNGEKLDLDKTTFSDAKITYSIDKNGYLCYYSVNTTMSQTIEAQDDDSATSDMSVLIDMSMTINNPGESVEITTPSDLSEYKTQEELLAQASSNNSNSQVIAYDILSNLYDMNTGERLPNYADVLPQLYNKYGKECVDAATKAFESSLESFNEM